MPFLARCPSCQAVYQVPDTLEGKKLRCKKCQQAFAAMPKGTASRPPEVRKAPPREESPEEPLPRSSRRESSPARHRMAAGPGNSQPNWVPLMIGGTAGGFLALMVVGGLILWFVVGSKNPDKGQPTSVASNNPSVTTPTYSKPVLPTSNPGMGTPVTRQTPPRSTTPSTISEAPEEPAAPPLSTLPELPALTVPPMSPVTPASPVTPVTPVTPPASTAPKGQLSAQTLADLKGATVFIKVEAGRMLSCSGSGFLVKVDGEVGYIVTNHHVINPEAELLTPIRSGRGTTLGIVKYKAKNAAISAVFHSGTRTERSLSAEVLTTDESRNLAVLRVRGLGNWPRPIALEDKVQLVETMPVFILGFPFGRSLSLTKGNPAITINKGSVSSLRENDYGQMKSVQIDGAINPGNSGGPVVDEEGHLVGISVATIRGAGIGLAIAPDELTRLFQGRVGGLALQQRKFETNEAEYAVEMSLIDPENQITSAALLYYVGNPLPRLKQRADGTFEPLAGAQRLDLQIDGQKATGLLKLTFNGPGNRFLNYQTCYVNGSGKTVHTQIGTQPLQAAKIGTAPSNPGRGTPRTTTRESR